MSAYIIGVCAIQDTMSSNGLFFSSTLRYPFCFLQPYIEGNTCFFLLATLTIGSDWKLQDFDRDDLLSYRLGCLRFFVGIIYLSLGQTC
jgi:hypothetical protein